MVERIRNVDAAVWCHRDATMKVPWLNSRNMVSLLFLTLSGLGCLADFRQLPAATGFPLAAKAGSNFSVSNVDALWRGGVCLFVGNELGRDIAAWAGGGYGSQAGSKSPAGLLVRLV